MNEKIFRILLGLGVAGLIAGTAGMAVRLVYGHVPMAYGSYVPWGLWVAFDLLFLGLTAGAYIIVVLTYGFGLRQFEPLAPLAVFSLLVSLLCEGIIISLDLGQPLRVYRFLVTPSFSSMLTWLVVFIVVMWIIFIPSLYLLLRERLVLWSREPGRKGRGIYRLLALGRSEYGAADRARDRTLLRILALTSIPVGFVFFAVPSAMFTDMLGRPHWSSAILPISYMFASYLSGCALITFLACIYHPEVPVIGFLGRLLRGFLILFLLVEFIQIFFGYRTDNPVAVAALSMITRGPNAWVFWMIHLLLGSLVPLVLLTARPDDVRAVAWAGFLIVVTFVAVRYNAIVPELMAYDLEGRDLFFVHRRLSQAYVPNIYEWLVSLWVVSLGIVLFLLGTRWLPLIPAEKGGERHAA
jgi:molybdopterin-containing oxidoreductase family membrane subunit